MTAPIQRLASTLWPVTILVMAVVMPWALVKGYREMKATSDTLGSRSSV